MNKLGKWEGEIDKGENKMVSGGWIYELKEKRKIFLFQCCGCCAGRSLVNISDY